MQNFRVYLKKRRGHWTLKEFGVLLLEPAYNNSKDDAKYHTQPADDADASRTGRGLHAEMAWRGKA